jgi:leucyl aminopeptidase
MKISFSQPALPSSGSLVVTACKGGKLSETAKAVDKAMKGALSRAMKAARFDGAQGKCLDVFAPAGLKVDRVHLIGLGDAKAFDDLAAQDIGGGLYRSLRGDVAAAIAIDTVPRCSLLAVDIAANVAFGLRLASYRFDKYRTKEKTEDKPRLKAVTVLCDSCVVARNAFNPLNCIADGVFMTRDLVSEPPNIIYPKTLAAECRKLSQLGVKVQVLGLKEMTKLGMGALLGVAQGSVQEPQMVIMEWKGASSGRKGEGPIAFVGKGVTFDTGGISIKPAAGMWDMKWDMGGAGTVIGLMRSLAGRKAKVHAIGVVGLVENMCDGNAQRPGDIVTSMSGQTIEVLNTDAEGRLVLADALWYTKERFKPQFMIDLATLTGAIVVALGHEHAGLFANNDELAGRLTGAGKAVNELLWRLPLAEVYNKKINSPAADIKNISTGRDAGSITAAQFIQRFVGDVPWAHLDIAGTAWSSEDRPTVPKGGTAYGVRLLDRLVADYYESK